MQRHLVLNQTEVGEHHWRYQWVWLSRSMQRYLALNWMEVVKWLPSCNTTSAVAKESESFVLRLTSEPKTMNLVRFSSKNCSMSHDLKQQRCCFLVTTTFLTLHVRARSRKAVYSGMVVPWRALVAGILEPSVCKVDMPLKMYANARSCRTCMVLVLRRGSRLMVSVPDQVT